MTELTGEQTAGEPTMRDVDVQCACGRWIPATEVRAGYTTCEFCDRDDLRSVTTDG